MYKHLVLQCVYRVHCTYTPVLLSVTTDIRISFERARYDVKEEDVELNDFIHIVKEDNRITEQVLDVFVEFVPGSDSRFAIEGEN